ncbi:hypothetical protein Q0812_10155 [Brevundimonas sp. 2R-24]|uniref:DUF4440 domain-containing protein n=1 Tax=Peiella sedimenti TaxID=3061083 RepID=A0ABT8SPL8_9CAUL|nr:hypothetical protein [Caulobacteraceae bacterium XZ-24]
MTQDEAQIGALIDEMYALISGPAGPRDWSRQRAVFASDARQTRTWLDDQGRAQRLTMGLEAYARNVQPFFDANPFYEVEIGRRIDVFGNIAHAWSLYEAKRDPSDSAPERRGINSIQLLKDPDGAWRIHNMVWDNEREGLVLPSL